MAQSRYLFSQKLSDYQIEKIIRAYTADVTATDTVILASSTRRSSRAANTVFRIYELLRTRLVEVGYYPDPMAYAEYWSSSPDLELSLHSSSAWTRLTKRLDELRGIDGRTAPHHVAESIFRANNPNLTPEAFFDDIKLIVKTTGPLNRTPVDVDVCRLQLRVRATQRDMHSIRGNPIVAPEARQKILAGFEAIIADYQKRIRAMKRKRRAGLGQ